MLSFAFLSACATYTAETQDIRSFYKNEKYDIALTRLEASDLKKSDKDRLLYRLEKSMIVDRMGDRKTSRALLIESDKIADELYTTSIARTAKSFLVSDSSTDYDGEDFEKVAIHIMLALSFIEDHDLKEAIVEARKINNKLAEINSKYDEKGRNRYAEDAFARYLSGMIYEAMDNIDSAIIDYAKALKLYDESYGAFYDGSTPSDLVEALYKLYIKRNRTQEMTALEKQFPNVTKKARSNLDKDRDYGELIVIHEVGTIAYKTTEEFALPIGRQIIRFSFPVIRNRKAYHSVHDNGIEVLKETSFIPASNVQNMNAIASFTLEDKRFRMVAKQGARLAAKGVLTEYAHENFGPLGGIAANIFAVVTETADTRSWTLLPSAFFVNRIKLKPGEYKIKITNDGAMNIVSAKIEKGKIGFLRSTTK